MTDEGNVIQSRRRALGLTQAETAAHVGMGREQFNQTERGKRSIGPAVAKRLADVLGGEPDDYLTTVRSTALDVAQRLLRRLDAGEQFPAQDLLEAADAVERVAALCARLAGDLRAAAQGDRLRR